MPPEGGTASGWLPLAPDDLCSLFHLREMWFFSMHFHCMEEYTGEKEPIIFWKASEVPSIFHDLDPLSLPAGRFLWSCQT